MPTTGSRDSFVSWGEHDNAHQAIQVGTFDVPALTLSMPVLFDQPMPSDSYLVFLQPDANIGAQAWPSNFTVDGFTVNLSTSVTATFSYLAVERLTIFGIKYTADPGPVPVG